VRKAKKSEKSEISERSDEEKKDTQVEIELVESKNEDEDNSEENQIMGSTIVRHKEKKSDAEEGTWLFKDRKKKK